ncbi:general transcription factor IIH polypeptide 5 GTF2H5 [Toxoplasma gondii TgCatPRC2]|uniref:General transcription and DNA repair factor IIH subunit TFB5 n=11 Tax=Toxoplasma gondii TaxID=5811 RepID=B9PQB4_TOXGV|nr:general transcription factor IIH polypeptide 5 GTF2H5 [Toxoplasma gondii ME49]EPR63845.1 general transcription factor IIH polypeptide 5 GTF2H5 [Toxoplasma gondii GT1]ESS34117.1 general transcription factor IIH polypeptide 5 GTF2H5 [Toxoplasma gondii VEG]KAF4638327.1 general transcription factor IIH polypeptide 5 GTF2H5 [Toxoplasma gondii]KFG47348.1 general transcription factor IIH polypeptide 5 GTF2H5 [Toxoplasma gondii GAB2-2007-GAL-DOM2]KFG50649.1 general transcription factor IIH polypept|eukprot:XP_002371312.1 general transcription factor IIH polypeptide 5 GTF2H5 [Toxoplasma gondii ME49]
MMLLVPKEQVYQVPFFFFVACCKHLRNACAPRKRSHNAFFLSPTVRFVSSSFRLLLLLSRARAPSSFVRGPILSRSLSQSVLPLITNCFTDYFCSPLVSGEKALFTPADPVNMVAALKGVLVKCDPPTMEVIRLLNETRDFIIEQLNEEYVLCRECVFDFLEEEVTKRLELAERQTAEQQREIRQTRQQSRQQHDQEE